MKKTKAARRSAVLNAVMVVAIVLIVAAGVLAVGSFKGWFDAPQPEVIVQPTAQPAEPEVALPEETPAPVADVVWVEGKTGFANITRKGISYSLDDGTKLRDGDIIETLNAASIDIVSGQNRLTLDENARVQVEIDEGGMFSLELNNGGLFASIAEPFALTLGGENLTVTDGVFAASAPYGSAGVYMLAGAGELGGKSVEAGKIASIVSGDITLGELQVTALNAFELSAAKSAANAGQSLCFTAAQFDEIETERERLRHDALEAQLLAEQSAEAIEQQRQENEQKVRDALAAQNQTTTTGGESGNLDYDDIVVQKPTCTIEIRCDTILDNMENLAEGKNAYVPASGCILAASRVSFDEGETVYDVLRRACDLAGIALEASWTPMYNSYYIEGIGNLYEFDCGEQSGWMYKVNGWFPNYGASSYTLSDGDSIVFLYTCNGYGADVGGGMA